MLGRTEPVPMNPPHLVAPTRCKVLRSFYVKGKPVPVGETVTLEYHLARDLAALGKVQILDEVESR